MRVPQLLEKLDVPHWGKTTNPESKRSEVENVSPKLVRCQIEFRKDPVNTIQLSVQPTHAGTIYSARNPSR